MIRIVVVEDEPILLKNIIEIIESLNSNFIVVGKAYNGREALQIINDCKPDVVFADIKMPIMGGLELISEIQKCFGNIPCVIITGYQDFEYARQSIRLNVEDYILKPISPIMLEDLLFQLQAKILCKNQEDEIQSFYRLIHNKNAQNHLNESIPKYKHLYPLLVCAGAYMVNNCSYITPSIDLWHKVDLHSIIKTIPDLKGRFWIIDSISLNEKVILIEIDLMHPLETVSERIFNSLKSYDYPITVVTHEIINMNSNLNACYQKMRSTLYREVIIGESRIIYTDNQAYQISHEQVIDSEWMKKMEFFLLKGQKEQFLIQLHAILDKCKTCSFTQLYLSKMFKKFTVAFSEIYGYSQSKSVDIEMDLDELLTNAYSYDIMALDIIMLFSELFDANNKNSNTTETTQSIAEKIQHYIDSHYAEPITQQTLADHFNFVPRHLFNIFKKHTGTTPTNYLINLRMKKARKLLTDSCPELLLREIAEMVGYEDSMYFSKVFKSICGMTPSEYKVKNKIHF